MANETPVVVSRTRRTAAVSGQNFIFEEGQVRTAGLSAGIGDYRRRAWQVYNELPMPTTQMEAWRRTDLRGLQAGSLRLVEPQANAIGPEIPAELLQPMADDEHAGQLLLQPHRVDVTLLPKLVRQGVVFTDLRTAEERYPHLLEQALGRVVRPEEGKFSALAGAFAQTGVLLYVPRGVQVMQPLHSILWTPGVGLAHVSHVIVWLEEGASATYIHEMSSPTETGGQTMHAGLVEVYVGAGANLRFVEMQSFGEHMWNVTHERVHLERDGQVDWVFGAMGGRLTKNFSELDLAGPGAVGKMSGFYFTDGEQHLDYDSQQNHLAPHTTSDLLFKGALVGQSRSVWQGMIYVAPGADKTDGYQANRNLVLSRKARADSIPGLEILADDVRCTHGATVGKVDEEQVFYLQARGIPELEARRLVVEGFFDPIMQRIPFEGVRTRFQDAIHQKMQAYTG
jgi:Fe-S cluster assembly protein SufD